MATRSIDYDEIDSLRDAVGDCLCSKMQLFDGAEVHVCCWICCDCHFDRADWEAEI